jgi:HD-GYP domain-containing protein (c-di-GMP phosphodiesterase class II)
MIEMKLDEIFKSLDKIEDITPDILHVSEGIQKICRLNGDAAIGWIMFNHLTTQKKTDYKYSIKHSIYTSIICSLIVDELTLSESDRISIIAAALTMNIAIIEQQDKLYYNSDRDLRQVQKVAIKIHPIRSVKLLEQKGVKDPLWLNTVLSHHEVIDGTGYTQKLKGEEILLSARIVSISDIYCAKVTGRSYRSGCNPNIVVSDLFIKGDKFIEGDLAKMFVKILGIYPPGTLVKLANNETAIVTHRNGDTPVIYSIFNSDGSPILEPIKRDCKVDEYLINKPIPYTDIDINIQKKQIWNIYHETVAK